MFRDVSCYGNTTARLKEYRLWACGMWSWWFFTDLQCFVTGLNWTNVLCWSVPACCVSCCVRRREQQLHVFCVFFFLSSVIWNAGDRCVAFIDH